MTVWQYAQLTVSVERHPDRDDTRTILWQGPEQSVRKNYSTSNQTVPELLNRFGADGWELAGIQDYREGPGGSSHWDTSQFVTVYTFRRPHIPTAAKSAGLTQEEKSQRDSEPADQTTPEPDYEDPAKRLERINRERLRPDSDALRRPHPWAGQRDIGPEIPRIEPGGPGMGPG
jgi:hypothetical protein